MQVGDLVKVTKYPVQEYGWIAEVFEYGGNPYVRVRFFSGEEDCYHPTQVEVVNESR